MAFTQEQKEAQSARMKAFHAQKKIQAQIDQEVAEKMATIPSRDSVAEIPEMIPVNESAPFTQTQIEPIQAENIPETFTKPIDFQSGLTLLQTAFNSTMDPDVRQAIGEVMGSPDSQFLSKDQLFDLVFWKVKDGVGRGMLRRVFGKV